ncbi:hypothetical protein QBC43DRAFT_320473 [Cladorrhinum sp. PSN259]|nr:hypothetical protein QBC43DRAFT_320473 [Cladorrhinum sp. PSN259]
MGKSKFAARQQRAQENLQQYEQEPLGGAERAISRKTQMGRDRIWQQWNTYWRDINPYPEPNNIWIDLCSSDRAAIAKCQTYLTDFVEYSAVDVPILDDEEETKAEFRVKSVRTVISMWRCLALEADHRVIRRLRDQEPNDLRWRTLIQGKLGTGTKGPVGDIDSWIVRTLSKDFDLIREQQFVKEAATEDDVMLILDTVWTRAEDIRCSAQTRSAFHTAVLLSSFGFRPGSVMNLKYESVRLGFCRDEANPAQNTLVAEVTVRHNKQKTDKVYSNQKHIVSLLLRSLACHPICLVTLLAVQALHDNAFDPPFTSYEELFNRPIIEKGILWLKWNREFLNTGRRILNIDYFQYNEIWNRTWQVAGNRTSLRPYSLRINAGAKYDNGALSDAARNMLLGHDTKTFQMSYQTRKRCDDVQSLVFPKAAPASHELFATLKNSGLERDPGAPIYPTAAELKSFEGREDLRELRDKYAQVRKEHAANSPQAHQAQAKIRHLIEKLSDIAVRRARVVYFQTIDRMRASGLDPTGRLPVSPPDPTPAQSHFSASYPAARAIGTFLQREESLAGQQRPQFAAMLLAFLGGRVTEVFTIAQVQKDAGVLDASQSFCLLCSRSFAQRPNLTRHHRNVHINKGAFNQPFSCPECQRRGKDCRITSVEEWSNHTEKFHGRQYTPNVDHSKTLQVQSKVQDERPRERNARCYVCGGMFFPGRSFSRHFNKEHVKAGRFVEPLPCWSCGDQQPIEGLSMWQTHVKVVHRCDPDTGANLSEGDVPIKRGLGGADCPTAPKRQRIHNTANDIDPKLLEPIEQLLE